MCVKSSSLSTTRAAHARARGGKRIGVVGKLPCTCISTALCGEWLHLNENLVDATTRNTEQNLSIT